MITTADLNSDDINEEYGSNNKLTELPADRLIDPA